MRKRLYRVCEQLEAECCVPCIRTVDLYLNPISINNFHVQRSTWGLNFSAPVLKHAAGVRQLPNANRILDLNPVSHLAPRPLGRRTLSLAHEIVERAPRRCRRRCEARESAEGRP